MLDGDDFYGERCELGENNHLSSPVALYREGMRRITYLSLRLSKRFPLRRSAWQVVAQMKEAQPHDAGGSSPRLNLEVFDGRWRLVYVGKELWSTPAASGRWVRFAFDVTYSTDASVGAVRMFVDRNGDGDALDRGERSRRYSVATLKTEGPGTDSDGMSDGDSIPSHLRVGIYHDPVYRCEGSRCSLGVDNVGVYNPAP